MSQESEIIRRQREFQRACELPIDTIVEADRNALAENYLFKAIEEIIELRKRFPSMMNRWAKNQGEGNREDILHEFSDVHLFLKNFQLVWQITDAELEEAQSRVQDNNFDKLKTRQMAILNAEMLRVPNKKVGLGTGVLTPRIIWIGQNPGQVIEHGTHTWDKPTGSASILLPILDKLRVHKISYLTNLVKSTTEDNKAPSLDLIEFWMEFLKRELRILTLDNPSFSIVAIGRVARNALNREGIDSYYVPHPALVFRHTISAEDYEKQVESVIAEIMNDVGEKIFE